MTMGFSFEKILTTNEKEELAEILATMFEEALKNINFKNIVKIKKMLKKKTDASIDYSEENLLSIIKYLFDRGLTVFLNSEKLEDITVASAGFYITIRKEIELEIIYAVEEVSVTV